MQGKEAILSIFPGCDVKLNTLDTYYKELVETNEHLNLTAITDYEEVYIKHFYDSLLLTKVIDIDNKNLCDVGSGAGFPGILLAIFTNCKVVIIDALQKRITFLNNLINKLNLDNVEAIHVRAEDYVKEKRSSFDIVTARAVAKLNILAELCLPLVKVGGYFVALKGSNEEELKEATNAIAILGARLEKTFTFNLPNNYGVRQIYLFKKVKECNKKYPRSFAKIKNNPL